MKTISPESTESKDQVKDQEPVDQVNPEINTGTSEVMPVSLPEKSSALSNPKRLNLPKVSKTWLMALATAGLLLVPSTIYLAKNKSLEQNRQLEALTVPVEAKTVTEKITASGEVQPVQRVNLSPKNQGRISSLYVEQGDRVKKGQIIAKMESRDLQAQLLQAKARLARAQANLAKLEAGTRPEQIAVAAARLEQAEARLDQLKAGSRTEEIQAAQARLGQAQANLEQVLSGSRQEEIAAATARLKQAESKLEQAIKGGRQEEVAQAQTRLNQAISQLEDAESGSFQEEIAQAESRIVALKADLELTSERVERYRDLQSEGAIAQDTYDEYVRDDRRVRATLQEAENRLQQLQKSRKSQIEQLKNTVERERQALQQLSTGARPEEIAQARAAVAEAASQLSQLKNGSRPEEVARAQAQVAEANSQLEQLINGTRPEEIAQAEAQVAEALSQLDELRNGTRSEDIIGAIAEVKEAESQVRLQEITLEDSEIRAPFDGIITQRYALEGAFVTPATSASSATSATSTSIVALAKDLEVLAKVPEADIAQIKPGQKVEITADAFPDQVFKGTVKLIAPEAVRERDVTLFQVRLSIEEGKEKLQSGMNVDIEFVGQSLDNAVVVPTVAIVTNKGKSGVLIMDENSQPSFQPVTIGPTFGNKIQILSGLKAGDRIFLELPKGKKLEDFIKPEK
jgi:HlyD family secretion protein